MAEAPGRAALGFTFTETMGGYVSPTARDYGDARRKRDRETFRFVVTIRTEDLKAFFRDAEHETPMTGTIRWSRLGKDAVKVEEGRFNLFRRDEDNRRQMRYLIRFRGGDGTKYRLDGYKDVHRDGLFDAWSDTTTLFTTITREDETGDEHAARGVLHIRPFDLVPQVLSMRGVGVSNPAQHVMALSRFGLFFAKNMVQEYGPVWRKNGPPPGNGATG